MKLSVSKKAIESAKDPKASLPKSIRTFNDWDCFLKPPLPGGEQWCGSCPFCGKEKHFFVEPREGMWDCKVCGAQGNVINFLEATHQKYLGFASDEDWRALETSRGIPRKYMERRGLAWTGSEWILPAFSEKGTIRDLRKYDGKQIMSTAGCEVQLYGIHELAKAKAGTRVWHCEGEWDTIAMDWLLDSCSLTKKDLAVGVPGASTFKDGWESFYARKDVFALYDNDEAGDRGAEKFYGRVKDITQYLHFVSWPHSSKTGYDARDYCCESLKLGIGLDVINQLLEMCTSNKPRTAKDTKETEEEKPKLVPIDLPTVIATFKKHLHVDKDLIDALRVMLAVSISNDMPGDPLWVYLVGASSSGKTQLLSSFAASDRCLFVSNISSHSLISGFKGEGGSDPSIIARARDLTVVFKDFTEVLSKPEVLRNDMFSILRGAYDGSISRPFGNGVVREYKDLYFTVLAGVTHAIHGFNNTSMGERFLKYQFKLSNDARTNAMLDSAIGNIGKEKIIEDDLQAAVSRFLSRKMDLEKLPVLPVRFIHRLKGLVQLIAYMRSIVDRDVRSQEVNYRPALESGTRLVKQLGKLAMVVAFVDSKSEVDDTIYELVERVAFDTAYGFNLDIVDAILKRGKSTREQISKDIGIPGTTLLRRLEDLAILKIINAEKVPDSTRVGNKVLIFEVNHAIAKLWAQSKGIELPTKKLTLKRAV